jgi:signal recognition particle receptor subunit beta
MVSINYSAREVCCKIVYYGPGLSGKTTNLQYIHSKVPRDTRGKLISLATEADRTLYFDFLPINIGTINDFQAKFQLYTVPGQVYYNATRKLVLRGVDGLVYVADSQPDKMDENIESLANLEENLREYGYDVEQVPLVLQYNKCDLPGVLSIEELNAKLNTRGLPYFQASATQGQGVFDTLKLIIKLVLDKAKSSSASAMSQKDTAASRSTPPPPSEPAPYPTPERVPADPEPTPIDSSSHEPPVSQTPQPVGVVAGSPSVESVQPTEAPVPAPGPLRPPGFRPYPGSETGPQGERKVSLTGFSGQTGELAADSLGRSIGADTDDDTSGGPSAMNTPQMAPSLRRRGGNRKRGFFKRLFGIK